MSDDDHDDSCEAEYSAGTWTDCGCWDRVVQGIKRLEEKP